jgi:hypothetical protein
MSRILRIVGGGLPAGWENKVAGGLSFFASTGDCDQLTGLLSAFGAPPDAIAMVRRLLELVPVQRRADNSKPLVPPYNHRTYFTVY